MQNLFYFIYFDIESLFHSPLAMVVQLLKYNLSVFIGTIDSNIPFIPKM